MFAKIIRFLRRLEGVLMIVPYYVFLLTIVATGIIVKGMFVWCPGCGESCGAVFFVETKWVCLRCIANRTSLA